MVKPNTPKALDVDADGDQDLVVCANAGASLTIMGQSRFLLGWFENDGSGVFSVIHPIDSTAQDVQRFEFADLDGDGDQDIVAVTRMGPDTQTGHTLWYVNTGGAFAPAQTITEEQYHYPVLAVGDVDGDGDIDIVEASGSELRWLENDGSGTSFIPHPIPSVQQCGYAALEDFDGDGDLDIAADAIGGLKYKYNTGNGVFSGNSIISGAGADHIAFAHLDGDAFPDLILSNSDGVIAYRNQEYLGFTGFVFTDTLSVYSIAHRAIDVDADGQTDIVGYRAHHGITWWRCLGNGTFAAPIVLVPRAEDRYIGFNPSFFVRRASEMVDLNGDGALDLAMTADLDGTFDVHLNNGNNTFGSAYPLMYASARPWACMVVDMDGDGDLDAVTGVRGPKRVHWFANDGTGAFSSERILGTVDDDEVRDLIALDGDGDADQDVLVVTDSAVVYLDNNGMGDPTVAIPITTGLDMRVATGDADGDGDIDFLLGDSEDGTLVWWLNNGNAVFAPASLITTLSTTFVDVGTADLDGDLDLDVAVLPDWPDDTLWTAINLGAGSYGPPVGHVLAGSGLNTGGLSMADLDNDGDHDVIIHRGTQTIFHANDGTGALAAPDTISSAGACGVDAMALADVDNDGDLDLIGSEISSALPSIYWVEHYGGLAFGPPIGLEPTGQQVFSSAVGDLDGDGLLDLLVASQSKCQLAWYPNHIDQSYPAQGRLFFDADSNGVADPGEPGLPGRQVWASPQGGLAYTDNTGAFAFYLPAGNHEVGTDAPGNGWALSTDSTTYHFPLSANDPSASDLDFGFKQVPWPPELTVMVNAGLGCLTQITLWMYVANDGSDPVDGIVRLRLDTLHTFISSTVPPDSIVLPFIYWSFNGLAAADHVSYTVEVMTPDVAYIGQPFSHEMEVTASNMLALPEVFTDVCSGVVSCAYDPNTKTVEPPGFASAGYVEIAQTQLVYTIHFQNTGNDTATTVVLRDHFDQELNWNSLAIMGSSHPFALSIAADGEAMFTFPNIFLPDSGANQAGSQGFVKFRIDLDQGLPPWSVITNSAAIYFDNNPPVITDTVITTLVDCSLFSASITETSSFVLEASYGISHQWFLDGAALTGQTGPTLFATADGDYTVVATDSTGCTAASTSYTVLGSSITELPDLRMAVRPNPFTSSTEVMFSTLTSANAELEVLDVTGRRLRTMPCGGQRMLLLERGALQPGVHIARLRVDDATVGVVRLVVN